MFNREWLLLRGPQIGYLRPPPWLLDTDMTCEQWLATNPRYVHAITGEDCGPQGPEAWPAKMQVRALALAWWLVDYGMADALNPALEQARTILGVPL